MIRILIVEGHAAIRKGLKQIILEEYSSAIVEAGDVESLVHRVVKAEWDIVIICGISIPGRSCIETLNQLKEITPKIPVLIMSMHPENQYALRVLKAGASGYLNIDSVHNELINAIQTVKIGRKYITPAIAERLIVALQLPSDKPLHERLSNREFDIFKMIASGKPIYEIAGSLSLSSTTVSTYRSRLLKKMGMKNNTEITRYALEQKFI